ncbi:MAG: penicillin acylase family protein [Myxococcales bacterium]|nr:penicillin acylase family protein [Myxococcales bacterium]
MWKRWLQPWQRQGAWSHQERLSGLGGPVEVRTDRWGISHLLTRKEEDLFRAQGYKTAQDRLFQMDITRRVGGGRLAELFGDVSSASWDPSLYLRGQGLTSVDYLMRVLGLKEAARDGLSWVSPRTYRALRAYSEGVNEFIEQNRQQEKLPLPYRLLQSEPSPWQAEDSLLVLRVLGMQLSFTWRLLLAFGALCHKLGNRPETLQSLLPPHLGFHLGLEHLPNDLATLFPASALGEGQGPAMLGTGGAYQPIANPDPTAIIDPEGTGRGSCAWVISGKYTQNGGPLLSNDPHLQMRLPCSFYQVRLWGGEYDVIGLSIPGVPGIFAGHNHHIAWGATLHRADDADIYLEELDQTGERYKHQDRYLPMIRREEILHVRGEAPRVRWVRSTQRGPLLSDALRGPLPTHRPYTLRWTGQEGVREAEAILQFNRARKWPEFLEALRHARVPALNYVYADKQGNIGAAVAGYFPKRPTEKRIFRPLLADDPLAAWDGEAPFDELPRCLNPEQGYLILSGQAPPTPLQGRVPTGIWSIGTRAQRIEELLLRLVRQKKVSPEEMARLQRDTYCLWSRDLIQRTLKTFRMRSHLSPEIRKQVDLLLEWNGRVGPESIAATFFTAFQLQLMEQLYKPAMGEPLYRRWLEISHELEPSVEPIFRSPDLWQQQSQEKTLHDALVQAYQDLGKRMGPDPQNWRWGKIHKLTLRPIFFRDTHHLQEWVRGPYSTGGSTLSINSGSFSWSRPFEQRVGAAARQIIDLGKLDDSQWILCGGQSEDPQSPHYDDQIEIWLQGDHVPMHSSTQALQPLRGAWLLPEDAPVPKAPLLRAQTNPTSQKSNSPDAQPQRGR